MNGLIKDGIDTFKAFGTDGVVVIPSLAFAFIELSSASASACSNIVHLCFCWGRLLLGPFVVLNPRVLVYP